MIRLVVLKVQIQLKRIQLTILHRMVFRFMIVLGSLTDLRSLARLMHGTVIDATPCVKQNIGGTADDLVFICTCTYFVVIELEPLFSV